MQITPSLQLLAFLPLLAALVLRLSPGKAPWLRWAPWAALSLGLAHLLGIADLSGIAALLAPAALLALRERMGSKGVRWGLGALVVFWCLVLALHRMPGIHNPRVLSGTLSPAAAEYQLFWNLDKAFAALYLVEFAVRRQAPTREPRFLVAAALALGAAMAVAWIGGLTRLEPKWTSALLWWAPANLLLVALPEETLFRLILQDRLEAWLGGMAGVAVAAILFGLAHFQGGWCYVASATAAGVGYGCAYRYQRNPWHPILTHFGLNALHFLAFVYPKLR